MSNNVNKNSSLPDTELYPANFLHLKGKVNHNNNKMHPKSLFDHIKVDNIPLKHREIKSET